MLDRERYETLLLHGKVGAGEASYQVRRTDARERAR
jgi:hypothetical protein